jgi:hypothetical protein
MSVKATFWQISGEIALSLLCFGEVSNLLHDEFVGKVFSETEEENSKLKS